MDMLDRDAASLVFSPDEVLAMGGPGEGAARFDHSVDLWAPPLNNADLDILPDKQMNDARVREMLRTDGFSSAGQDLYRNHIVGAAFLLQAKPEWRILVKQDKTLDEVWGDEFQDEVQTLFTLWAESPQCWPDASRRNTLTGLVRLGMGSQLASGELLASVEWLRDTPRPFHTAFQMIEPERLETPWGQMGDTNVRAGVRVNDRGAPQGYYIRKAHRADFSNPDSMEFAYVDARKPWGRPQMIHLIEQTRINQTRGVSKLVAAVKEMKIAKKYRDVTLQHAIVNATYAATIESELPPEAAYAQLGAGVRSSVDANATTQWAQQYLQGIASYLGSSKSIQIDGVKIPHLYPGTKLSLNKAGAPEGVGEAFEKSLLRYIAANLGVSYEEFSRDYSSSNYSSIKAAIVETWKQMQAIKKLIADRFATQMYRCWLEEAVNNNMLSTMKPGLVNTANFYAGMNCEAYTNCEWIGAARGQIDELKETQAAVLRLKYNLSTWEDEIARTGGDYKKTFAQREKEKEDMEKRGLTVEESNSVNAASGAPREKEGGNEDA